MLGELLHESSGQIIGTRVLPPEGGEARIEVTAQSTEGTLLGHRVSVTGTYWWTVRPGGAYYAEGRVVFVTPDGEIAEWSGFGIGRPSGPAPAATFATCGAGRTSSPSLARLNGVATVTEYDVDESGRWTWKLYEWLPASVPALAGGVAR